ncbi:MAG: PEPxxWA-CTERM sorting domain-containing protein [Pseudomonadota bacterium]|jgi:hypothetical protein
MTQLKDLLAPALGFAALAGSAQALDTFEITGTAGGGEVVEFQFDHRFYHRYYGMVTFEGGTLDYTTLRSEGVFPYLLRNPGQPREFIDVAFYASCTAPSDLPCFQFSDFTDTSFRFTTLKVPYQHQSEVVLISPPPPPGRFFFPGAHHELHSTLSFLFVPDGNNEVTYTIEGVHTVPEPATWAVLIVGFTAVGARLRKLGRRRAASTAALRG